MQTYSMKELFGNKVSIAGKSTSTVKNIPAKKSKALDNSIDFLKQDAPLLNKKVTMMKTNSISSLSPNDRVNTMLGMGNTAGRDKANSIMFGNSMNKTKTINPNNIVNEMFSNSSKHSLKANSFMGMGSMPKSKGMPINIKSMMGIETNAFRTAKIGKGNNTLQRIGMQNNLTMRGQSPFGDFDGDRIMNIFDCNPMNRRKQGGEIDNISGMDVYNVPTENQTPNIQTYDASGDSSVNESPKPIFFDNTPQSELLEPSYSFESIINEEVPKTQTEEVPKTQIDFTTDIPGSFSRGYDYLKSKGNIAIGNIKSKNTGFLSSAGNRVWNTFIPTKEEQMLKQQRMADAEKYVNARARQTASLLRSAGVPSKKSKYYASDFIMNKYKGSGILGIPSGLVVPEYKNASNRDLTGIKNVGTNGMLTMSSLPRSANPTPLSSKIGQLTGMQRPQPSLPQKQIEYNPVTEPIQPPTAMTQPTGRLIYSPYSKRPVTYTRGKYNKLR